ncbi:MAG TPA: peptidylprolyl isomerase [Chthonomonadaceae bacterium]|nr:peptidylprolyl isomerase [Chthonomonadaceae bacterium]
MPWQRSLGPALLPGLSLRPGVVLLLAFCGLLAAAQASVALGPPASSHSSANPRVSMVVANRGTIILELYPKAAPKTVAHFLSLARRHFYDGILFHRVIPGFMAQGGDPASKKVDGAKIANISPEEAGALYHLGEGGSGQTVPLEATLPHDRGTIGLARTSDPNSGDSQFFLNFVPNHRLDNQYTVFGKIVKSLDVLDKIHQGDRIKTIRVLTPGKSHS